MTYQPLLPEVAGGEIEPRNVTVHLRQALPKRQRDPGATDRRWTATLKTATIEVLDGRRVLLHYDQVVLALGAVTRTFPTPGLEEEGDRLQDHRGVAVPAQPGARQCRAGGRHRPIRPSAAKALTFVFIGGGYTGVEAVAELSDLSKIALRNYPDLKSSDLHWVLLEAVDRVAAEVGPNLSQWTLAHLRRRGIDVRLNTTMKSCIDGQVVLSDGDSFAADTIVWTAGMKPNPVLDATNVPRGPKGHATANAKLQVIREDGSLVDGAWAAGDNAQVPDLTPRTPAGVLPGNAQNAVRQAKRLAKNMLAAVHGEPIVEYRHKSLGTLASYGVGKGAAVVLGVPLKGLPAWLVDRVYHGLSMPTYAAQVPHLLRLVRQHVHPARHHPDDGHGASAAQFHRQHEGGSKSGCPAVSRQ